ncbi:MAG: ATP-binding protein [Archaeoglobaceae archaeon]
MSRFIDRERELEFLENNFSEQKSLVVIYGRRRVGKTELVKKFSEDKNLIYFLADKRGTLINAERFATVASKHFGDVPPRVENFDDVFKYISSRTGSDKAVVVIDEFSYLVEKDSSIPSVFQLIWDEIVREGMMLILLGSSISMMEKGVLSYKSPLYGRRTGQWKVTPLPFKEVTKFHKVNIEKAVEVYAVFGGIPMYLNYFNPEKDIFSNVEDRVFRKGSVLNEEVEFLLREELSEYSSYLSILEAIAHGRTRIVEIADYSKIQAKDLPKYLNNLIKLEVIKKEHPVTEKIKTKKTVYKISDNFFRFYFKFVHPYKSDLEIGKFDRVKSKLRDDFNSFLGETFEDISREFILETYKKGVLPFDISKIGKWWQRKVEVDIVTLGERDKEKEVGFFECKWSALSENEANRIIEKLKSKAKTVNWHKDNREDYYGIIAKRVKGKQNLKNKGYLVFDLKDFDELT